MAESSPSFDEKKAGENLAVAVLPILYEQTLNEGRSVEEARALVRARVPQGDDVTIIRHQNTTAVVVHQRETGKITVAYDATDEFRDRMDNLHFAEQAHPLGGRVHRGSFNSIAREDEQGHKISDKVRAAVEGYAAQHDAPMELTLTGYSRGGAQSVATAAQWMSEGMPANTRLTDVETFGGLAYGNKQFMDNFLQEAQRTGVQVTQVIAGADPTPTYMTTPNFMSDMYVQGGDAVHLMPGGRLVNPSSEALAAAQAGLEQRNWHDPNIYADMLNAPQARLPQMKSQSRQEPGSLEVPESQLQTPTVIMPAKELGRSPVAGEHR